MFKIIFWTTHVGLHSLRHSSSSSALADDAADFYDDGAAREARRVSDVAARHAHVRRLGGEPLAQQRARAPVVLEAVAERHPLDRMPELIRDGVAVAVLKFWRTADSFSDGSRPVSRARCCVKETVRVPPRLSNLIV